MGGVLGGVNGQPKPTTYRQNLDVVALVLQIAGEILQSRLDLRGKVQRQREKTVYIEIKPGSVFATTFKTNRRCALEPRPTSLCSSQSAETEKKIKRKAKKQADGDGARKKHVYCQSRSRGQCKSRPGSKKKRKRKKVALKQDVSRYDTPPHICSVFGKR